MNTPVKSCTLPKLPINISYPLFWNCEESFFKTGIENFLPSPVLVLKNVGFFEKETSRSPLKQQLIPSIF